MGDVGSGALGFLIFALGALLWAMIARTDLAGADPLVGLRRRRQA